eukprot:gene23964-9536_t
MKRAEQWGKKWKVDEVDDEPAIMECAEQWRKKWKVAEVDDEPAKPAIVERADQWGKKWKAAEVDDEPAKPAIVECADQWGKKWKAAEVDDEPAKPAWLASDQCGMYIDLAQRKLKAGVFAVQIHADYDHVSMPDGSIQDLWTSDPWMMIAMSSPGTDQCTLDPWMMIALSSPATVPHGAAGNNCKQGHRFGSRVIQRLVDSMERICGPDGVANLTLILHVSEEQVHDVQAEVWAFPELFSPSPIKDRLLLVVNHRQYGYCFSGTDNCFVQDPSSSLDPIKDRLLLVVHHRQYGYCFSETDNCFVQDPSSSLESMGTGYSMLQLGWPGEALRLADDDDGEIVFEPVTDSVLDILSKRGVE